MERWDLIDRQRRPLGRTMTRGEAVPEGCYYQAVSVCVVDAAGRLLLTLRDAAKASWPLYWENTGGAVLAGETSLQGVLRELREETGLIALPEELRLLASVWRRNAVMDVYLWLMTAPPGPIALQPGETADYRWVDRAGLVTMMETGQIAGPIVETLRTVWPMLDGALRTDAPLPGAE